MKSGSAPAWLRKVSGTCVRLAAEARRAGHAAAGLVVEGACPPLCAACLTDIDPTDPRDLLCPGCRAALPRDGAWICIACGGGEEGPERHRFQRACALPTHRNYRARCLYWMNDPVPAMIHQLKYRGVWRLAEEWGGHLGDAAREIRTADAVDWLLPVPLHPGRERRRGYNQSALLARGAARRAGVPCVEDALVRVRRTPTQTRLSLPGRLANLESAFRVSQPALVRGARVVLVDDVVTTGATLVSAVECLVEAGAASVTALAVARA